MDKQKRMVHIDGYKGLLCFFIMLGHFWNITKNTVGASPLNHKLLDLITTHFGDYMLRATFWLYAFLVISGFLLSYGKVKTTPELLSKSLGRFLRFFIPILGACCIIYGIQEVVGWHVQETKEFFTNKWYQNYYKVGFAPIDIWKETVKAMTKSSCRFNAPFWVIRDMFISSVLIYVCKYTDHISQKRVDLLPIVFTLLSFIMDNPVMTACFAGYLVGYYKDSIAVLTAKVHRFLIVFTVIFGMVLWVKSTKVLPKNFDDLTVFTLFHCFLLILLTRISLLQKVFSCKLFLLMGKFSFGVYAFHWPVICSVGSLVLLAGIKNQWGALITFTTAFVVSVICTAALSVVYYYTVEKASDWVVGLTKKLPAAFQKKEEVK